MAHVIHPLAAITLAPSDSEARRAPGVRRNPHNAANSRISSELICTTASFLGVRGP
jgi:hypothetical protein